jgi:hypothetical protein
VAPELLSVEQRRLARLALTGLAVATIAAAVYLLGSGELVRGAALGPLGLPYVLAAVVGVALQAVAWGLTLQRGASRGLFALAATGCVLTVLAVSVVREAVRLTSLEIGKFYEGHAGAATIEGLSLFLTFAVVNGGLLAACVWLVRSEIAKDPSAE